MRLFKKYQFTLYFCFGYVGVTKQNKICKQNVSGTEKHYSTTLTEQNELGTLLDPN